MVSASHKLVDLCSGIRHSWLVKPSHQHSDALKYVKNFLVKHSISEDFDVYNISSCVCIVSREIIDVFAILRLDHIVFEEVDGDARSNEDDDQDDYGLTNEYVAAVAFVSTKTNAVIYTRTDKEMYGEELQPPLEFDMIVDIVHSNTTTNTATNRYPDCDVDVILLDTVFDVFEKPLTLNIRAPGIWNYDVDENLINVAKNHLASRYPNDLIEVVSRDGELNSFYRVRGSLMEKIFKTARTFVLQKYSLLRW